MKVSDILIEQNEECVGETMKELFHDDYEDIAGVVGMAYEDILEIMQDIVAKQRDVNFQKEQDILNRLMQMEDQETIYISSSDDLHRRLDKLHDVINSEAETMTVVKGIQEFVMLLGKHTTTKSAWENSPDGEAAYKQAEEICSEPSDPYQRYGVKPSDFY